MKHMRGNIWDFVERKYHVTVPVNIGWVSSSPRHTCHPEFIMLYPHAPLVFFPTKELNKRKPWKSWASKSKKPYIMRMLGFFPAFADMHGLERIAVPLLGSGAGGLDPIDMASSIKDALKDDDRFTLVTPAYI